MTFGSLFAGIGGFDLGFERAGLTCEWQVEIDPYCQKVLAKHWPGVRRWDDVRTFPPDGQWYVDVICGGFPCQDISNAGKRVGITGERSGLFYELMRIVRELGPRIVVLENVAALLDRGMGDVLGSLAEVGFDAEWHCIPASALGAPHIRDRVFILANSQHDWIQERRRVANAYQARNRRKSNARDGEPCSTEQEVSVASNSNGARLEGRSYFSGNARAELATAKRSNRERGGQWATEPAVGRVANGVPCRVDRIRGLGNSIVPQVAEWIGRQLVEVA